MGNENEETSTVIDTLEKELDDIGNSVDACVAVAEKHLEDRINAGETESILLSVNSKESSKANSVSLKSTISSSVSNIFPHRAETVRSERGG